MREQPDFAWYPHLVSITYYRVHHVPYLGRGATGGDKFFCVITYAYTVIFIGLMDWFGA